LSQTDFSSLNLPATIVENLSSLKYEVMTPIQAQSLPLMLEGRDVIAQAKTGSGKTAAFGLGLLQKLDAKNFRVQSLVLCPTRELADQVSTEIRRLARGIGNVKVLTLCGGSPFGPQIGSLEHGAHIVVGTPGRIQKHLEKSSFDLENLTTFVLDEADRMLDMGFQPALDAIAEYLPAQRQTLLFSATFPKQIEAIAKRLMQDPAVVKVEEAHDESSIEQHFYKVNGNDERMDALRLLLMHHRPASTLIFCNTKRDTQDVAKKLRDDGFSVLALHGDLEQKDRDQTLVCFSNKSASILVGTDVAARGLDIDALDAVINYHISPDSEVHVHRIGRTGRAGNKGIACSLYDSDKESYKIAVLEEYLEQTIKAEPLPATSVLSNPVLKPAMTTLRIEGGKKQKIRAGDILGALTAKNGITGKQVGKINLHDNWAYVAVNRDVVKVALSKLTDGKLKGRSFRVRQIKS